VRNGGWGGRKSVVGGGKEDLKRTRFIESNGREIRGGHRGRLTDNGGKTERNGGVGYDYVK